MWSRHQEGVGLCGRSWVNAVSKYRELLLAVRPLMADTPCAYCHFPFSKNSLGQRGFEVDHIKPQSRYPELAERIENLAWACVRCNGKKGDHIDGRDPETGEFHSLMNPNEEDWEGHFSGHSDGKIHGITATGRATGERLKFNTEQFLLELRSDGYAAGWWPA